MLCNTLPVAVVAALVTGAFCLAQADDEAIVMSETRTGFPVLHSKLELPPELLATKIVEGRELVFGGDLRIGDLTGDGRADLLVYRSVDNAHDGGGMKPCFLGAFSMDGEVLWTVGEAGDQPCRPGPVAIHDIDGDGAAEVVCFFLAGDIEAPPDSMKNVVVQIRDGRTGAVLREAAPPELTARRGRGPNWCHQRILLADLRGTGRPQDFVVKLGDTVVGFDETFEVLWSYHIEWNEYGRCSAYIPAVGDIDGDGRDEVNGGYYLLDDDGTPLWEKSLGPHMDSVAVTAWDGGRVRAVCSGHGHVMDAEGNVVLRLGGERVPHGQELRVARFRAGDLEPQMVLRYNGHSTDVIVVDVSGAVVNSFRLNPSPNNTGMEVVYWHGPEAPAWLYNGGMLWEPMTGESVSLPGLPKPVGPAKMGWYHCIPADVCGDGHEEVVLYNPWDTAVYIYSPHPVKDDAYAGYRPGPRQYNARLMD